MKSQVDNKHRVTSIDLYIKHRVKQEEVRVKTDRDAGVFRLRMADYDIMEKNLKMYPLEILIVGLHNYTYSYLSSSNLYM